MAWPDRARQQLEREAAIAHVVVVADGAFLVVAEDVADLLRRESPTPQFLNRRFRVRAGLSDVKPSLTGQVSARHLA